MVALGAGAVPSQFFIAESLGGGGLSWTTQSFSEPLDLGLCLGGSSVSRHVGPYLRSPGTQIPASLILNLDVPWTV